MLKTNVEYIGMISIHALHEESDYFIGCPKFIIGFQSTLSMRRATVGRVRNSGMRNISIHALHEESDRLER